MDNTNDERQESFVASLDQFFTSIEPVLKEANSVEAAEDLLTNLETTDENFHRYDFVRKLRARIDEMIGPLIDMKLDSLSGDSGSNALLSQIADEIQTSQEFISLQQSVLTDTKEAVNTLVQKYGNPLQRGASDNEFSDHKACRTHPLKDSLDLSDEESLSSSIGQVGYMFMSQEKSGKIAENLHPLKPVQLKIEALSSLAQVPQSDIITSEHWPAIRKGLLAALADDDDHLSEKSLKFHARMFLCSTSHATREIYTCLAEHVWHCFNSKSDMIGVIEHGINVQTKNNARLLKRFRLLNEFQHEVPSYWTRYSERFLEEILESTFTLIDASDCQSSSSSVDQLITPIHYLSLLDPMASWFKKWMHGNYSRTEVVKQLKEHPRLLSDAVAAILDFPHTLKTAVTIPEILEDQDQQEREESGSEEGLFYSARDLEFLFFVHSLCLVGRMFIYNDGRDLFPIELPDRQETLTVTDLLVVFIKIMCIPMPKSMAKAGLDGTIVPEDLVSNVLQEIASSSEAIRECLCKDAITSSLLAPVQNILDGFMDLDSNEESDTESVLLLISDVVAALASSENGRLQLLYGESQERWQRSRLSPAHIIAGFSKKALSDSLCVSLSNDVMGGFLFICRQLWTTSEGLMVLNPYALHEKVANAWKTANELHISPPIDDQDDEEDQEMIQNTDNLVWETSLLDNLLNFAGTPKGVLLLQQTGMMDKCVGYMYERYTKKLQVSKCEKFGYGVMVCQFAATAPGIVQLEKKGYLQRLIQDVWLVFEGLHNRRLQPIIKHIDTIDSRTYIKALNNLLGVFSAFPAVYEILTVPDRPSTSTSEVEEIKPVEDHGLGAPQTLAEFFDRLVIIDNDNKISSLFNYEQTHHFGLRILNVLCSCLDTFLFLESTYHFTDLLLQAQLDNRLDNGKDYIIDRCSIERNQILVKSYWVGGPSERILPGRTLTEDPNNPYPWPLFSCFPPPKDYVVQDHAVITNAFEEGDSILEFLEGEKPTGAESIEWLEKFRETFCTTIKSGTFKCKTKVLKLLLESVCHALTNIPEESIFPLIEFSVGELSLKNTELSSIETLGVKLAIRYGLQLKILQSSRDATDDLHHLLKYAKFFMRSQQKVQDSTLRTLSVEYPGHDWFVSTIFLMFGGDPEESREFLFKFSSLVCSGYLWIRRLHASVHLPASLTVSGIPPLYSCTCHNIELILQAEVPLVFSAFRMSGYTPSQICQHWLRQCFWNYLPWDHICLYICVCLTLGIDYQVYFCIAIFKHLQQEILKSTQEQTLLVMLKEEPIRNFRLGDHLDFMLHLEKRYRLTILSDLQNITRP